MLSKEITEILREPGTVKVLTTTDENGVPHSVIKASLVALDGESLGYIEMIERSRTYKNILRNCWDKKLVSICVYNEKKGVSYQIKAEPYKYEEVGPVWDEFLKETWERFPDSDPKCVWILKPKEVINEDLKVRKEAEDKRVITQKTWHRFRGIRE